MIAASTAVALPLLIVALLAQRFRSDFEETAWRLIVVVFLATPLAALLPKVDVGFDVPLLSGAELAVAKGLVALHAVGALALLARLAFAVVAAMRLRRSAVPFGDASLSPFLRVPVTVGLLRPSIVLPREARAWSAEKLAAVLAHEAAHVARRDPLWRFLARLATALCWFHPLAWLASAALERLAEEAADRSAVERTGDRHAYAGVLLDLVRTMTGTRRRFLAAAMLDGRALDRRVDAILAPPLRRRAPRIARIALAMLAGAAIFLTAMTENEGPPPRLSAISERRWSQEELFAARDRYRQLIRDKTRSFFRTLFR